MRAKRRAKTEIPIRIVNAIERVWPDGIVEIDYDLIEGSYFHELHPKLQFSLLRIKGATLRYEREGNEQWQEENDGDSGDPDWCENPPTDDRRYSYHLFFICPDDERFRYADET